MKSNYDILGNHIRLIDTRNRESITDRVLGINIDKFFMPSVANVIGTDLSKYKLITKGKFACNPMHVGRDERLPVALYDEEEPAINSLILGRKQTDRVYPSSLWSVANVIGRKIKLITKERKFTTSGVSVQKKFIPSIANTVGTDFKKYKVVKKDSLHIFQSHRRGDKIGIALLEDDEEGLVSNVYTVFEIIDEKQLIPEYLMLWFSRPEFDRYARFKSHGSVREVMDWDWDEMCKVELQFRPMKSKKRL